MVKRWGKFLPPYTKHGFDLKLPSRNDTTCQNTESYHTSTTDDGHEVQYYNTIKETV
jgi:hypothetical protein